MTASRIFARLPLAIAIGFLVMTPPAYFRYSTVGLDTDRLTDYGIRHRYYRLRWPGDGTVRFGGGIIDYTLDEEDLDPIDPVGRLLETPKLDRHRPARQGFGYWHGAERYDQPVGRDMGARWISLPAWLPGILLLAAIGIWKIRR